MDLSGNSVVTSQTPMWYYAEAGHPVGPFELSELKRHLGRLPNRQDRFVWRDGWVDWRRTSDLPELRPSARRFWTKVLYGFGAMLAGLLGVGIGVETAKQFGLNFWIPVICLSLSFLAVRATKVRPAIAPVLGVSAGQWLLFLKAIALVFIFDIDQTLSGQSVTEVLLLGILVFWLWFTQSSTAVIAIVAYETLTLATDGYSIASEGLSVALVIQIVLRLGALAAGCLALAVLPGARSSPSPSSAPR